MIQQIKAKDRHFRDSGWLQTYWLFSFSDYYDPENVNHGALRVFNDDVVQAHTGFNTHPHEEMEIVSIVLEGEMTHKDTMGNEAVIRKDDVQRMTAGTGLQHSEWNHSDDDVAFFQIWILPDKKGLHPSYDQKSYSPTHWKNNLALLASSHNQTNTVKLNSEASIFRATLEPGHEVRYTPEPDHCQFLYVVDGSLLINTIHVDRRDQLRIQDEKEIIANPQDYGEFVLIDVPRR